MSKQYEVYVEELQQQVRQLQFQMAQVMTAITAMAEMNNNAVLESDELPKEAQNGRIRKGR